MVDLIKLTGSQEATNRRRQMLQTAFGAEIAQALADPAVIEVMVNPDGKLWVDQSPEGRSDTGETMSAAVCATIASRFSLPASQPVISTDWITPSCCIRVALSQSRYSSRAAARRTAWEGRQASVPPQ